MQVDVTARHLKLTEAIETYVADKVNYLEHLTDEIISARAVIWHDETKSPDKSFGITVHLNVPGPDVHAEATAQDMYAAIDAVEDKLARLLRKRKTRMVESKQHKLQQSTEREKRFGGTAAV